MREKQTKEYQKKYREKNHERLLKYKNAWYKKNNERLRKQARDYYAANPEKIKEYQRIGYLKYKDRVLDRKRYRKYGITGDEFRKIAKKQKGKCPICKRKLDKNPSVDHNHVTGKIRGLICNPCNLAIGNAEDSPDRLRAMANYLENKTL